MRGKLFCEHGDINSLSYALKDFLLQAERDLGMDFYITSGYRCEVCNTAVGGARNSAHKRGQAVDIACEDNFTRFKILEYMFLHGIKRLGVARDFIHIDFGEEYNGYGQKTIWFY